MGRALLLLLIGAGITAAVLYPRHLQKAVETIVPPDEAPVAKAPRPLVSETQLHECLDACEARQVLERVADSTVRACRNACQARAVRPPHETPSRITVTRPSRP